MRVIITARQGLSASYEGILTRLVNILGEISKNPSNPKFNQYCFESISALIRYVSRHCMRRSGIRSDDSFVCQGSPAALPKFESALFGPAQIILAQDVTGES
jgi:exportin-2 (importin alpha re-exporter)